MKYDLTKFEENLQLINDLISNLTNRSNNLTYLNLLGEYCKTIYKFKIRCRFEKLHFIMLLKMILGRIFL